MTYEYCPACQQNIEINDRGLFKLHSYTTGQQCPGSLVAVRENELSELRNHYKLRLREFRKRAYKENGQVIIFRLVKEYCLDYYYFDHYISYEEYAFLGSYTELKQSLFSISNLILKFHNDETHPIQGKCYYEKFMYIGLLWEIEPEVCPELIFKPRKKKVDIYIDFWKYTSRILMFVNERMIAFHSSVNE